MSITMSCYVLPSVTQELPRPTCGQVPRPRERLQPTTRMRRHQPYSSSSSSRRRRRARLCSTVRWFVGTILSVVSFVRLLVSRGSMVQWMFVEHASKSKYVWWFLYICQSRTSMGMTFIKVQCYRHLANKVPETAILKLKLPSQSPDIIIKWKVLDRDSLSYRSVVPGCSASALTPRSTRRRRCSRIRVSAS